MIGAGNLHVIIIKPSNSSPLENLKLLKAIIFCDHIESVDANSMAATTSSSCTGFLGLRSNPVEPRVRAPSSHGPPAGCGKLDGVAMWFINGVTTAFFASLERCSCIRIATVEDAEEANDLPLILNDGNLRRDGAGTASRRRTGKTKKNNNGGALVDEDVV